MPTAIYELATLAWAECCNPPEGEAETIEKYRKDKFNECEELLNKAKAWESYGLDARIGMRIQSGLETLSWFKRKMKW